MMPELPTNLDLDFLDYTPTTTATQNESQGLGQGPRSVEIGPGVQIRIPDDATGQQSLDAKQTQPSTSSGNLLRNLLGNAAKFGGSQTGMSEEALRQIILASNRQKQQQKSNKTTGGFNWGLNYLSQYFDVTTTDVVERILWSAIPIRKTGLDIDYLDDADELMAPLAGGPTPGRSADLLDSDTIQSSATGRQRPYSYMERFVQSRPDFYGPFWISATLVFVIGIFSNVISLVDHNSKLEKLTLADSLLSGNAGLNKSAEVYSNQLGSQLDDWHYSMDELNMASSLVMVYMTIVPTSLWFLLWFRGCNNYYTLTETISAYGYSLSIFVPLALLLIVQAPLFRYLMMTLAATVSGVVLILSFLPVVRSQPNSAGSYGILAIIPFGQFGLAYVIHRIMLQ